jgi:hypothetical protein
MLKDYVTAILGPMSTLGQFLDTAGAAGASSAAGV